MNSGDAGELTRRFAAGPANFAVRCPSNTVKKNIEALFVDLSVASSGDSFSEIVLTTAGSGLLDVQVEAGVRVTAQRPLGAMTSLVTAVTRLALDADPSRLHLHCAALSLGGRGVLISAASGTGKTTLAASLARRGWTYVSDETVALESGSTTVSGFPKPLVIKPGGGDLLPDLETARIALAPSNEAPWWHVPVSALPASVDTDLAPSVIVILHRKADGSTDMPPVVTPMHPADAVVALMGQTMDAERFGTHAVDVLARLAARCRCVAMSVGPLDIATSMLEELVQSEVEPEEVRELERMSDMDIDGWQVADSVRSAVIGDRVVVHDTANGAIAGLDEAGSAVWSALHGFPPPWWPPDTMRSTGTLSFLDQLASYGLVSSPGAQESTGA